MFLVAVVKAGDAAQRLSNCESLEFQAVSRNLGKVVLGLLREPAFFGASKHPG